MLKIVKADRIYNLFKKGWVTFYSCWSLDEECFLIWLDSAQFIRLTVLLRLTEIEKLFLKKINLPRPAVLQSRYSRSSNSAQKSDRFSRKVDISMSLFINISRIKEDQQSRSDQRTGSRQNHYKYPTVIGFSKPLEEESPVWSKSTCRIWSIIGQIGNQYSKTGIPDKSRPTDVTKQTIFLRSTKGQIPFGTFLVGSRKPFQKLSTFCSLLFLVFSHRVRFENPIYTRISFSRYKGKVCTNTL